MKITDKDVVYVAELAKLGLTETERQRMIRDFNSILGYIDLLNELNTTDVPPMTQTVGAERYVNVMRKDELLPCLTHEEALENAPDTDGNFFKVPKVIEK